MVSTHVLDLALGLPAAGVSVALEKMTGTTWSVLAEMQTDSDGRISFANAPQAGAYQLRFQVDEYQRRAGREAFFTEARVTFQISDTGRKYHIPLLLSPYGYSTYRGS